MMAEGESRQGWRRHPLLKRLLLPVFVLLGLWLWRATEAPERELVWRLEGFGWSTLQTVEFQVTAADGELLKRDVRYLSGGVPSELTVKERLPPGTYQVRVFTRERDGTARPPLVQTLTLGAEETRVERSLRLPAGR